MNLKPGVRILGVKPETVVAMMAAGHVYRLAGYEFTVTSCVEGKHSRGSIHYQGLAFDCRTAGIPTTKMQEICNDIRGALGADFDVVLEIDHLHVEFEPKEPL